MEQTTKIEYAVFDTTDSELQIMTGEDRERAFRLAHWMNKSVPGSAIVMSRVVVTSEWAPANTGVVPPWIGEKE
jgi:hypothetical protein